MSVGIYNQYLDVKIKRKNAESAVSHLKENSLYKGNSDELGDIFDDITSGAGLDEFDRHSGLP